MSVDFQCFACSWGRDFVGYQIYSLKINHADLQENEINAHGLGLFFFPF